MKKSDYLKVLLYVEKHRFGTGEGAFTKTFSLLLCGFVLYVGYAVCRVIFPILCILYIILLASITIPSGKEYMMCKKCFLRKRVSEYENFINQYDDVQKEGFELKEKSYYEANLQCYRTESDNLLKKQEKKLEKEHQEKTKRVFLKKQHHYNNL